MWGPGVRVGKVSLFGWCRVTEMWVDIPWASRGPGVGVWGVIFGSTDVTLWVASSDQNAMWAKTDK